MEKKEKKEKQLHTNLYLFQNALYLNLVKISIFLYFLANLILQHNLILQYEKGKIKRF